MDRQRRWGADRGQLVVVVALVLAMTLVALALILNSGISAENLSTRQTSGSENAVEYTQAAETAIADAYRIANGANATTTSGVDDTFTEIVESWADARSNEAAKNGISAGFEQTAHLGWHLEQNENRSFTPEGDSTNQSWQVAHGAENVGTFQVNVTREDLYDADANFGGTEDNAFHLKVENGTDSWLLYIFQNASTGEMIVHQGNPNDASEFDDLRGNSTHTCIRESNGATIDFEKERFKDDQSCTALNFSDDVTGPVDIRFENPHSSTEEQINGTYSFVLNGSTAAGPRTGGKPVNFNETGGDAPTAQAVVYSVTYTAEYERSDARFGRTRRYAVREETYAG